MPGTPGALRLGTWVASLSPAGVSAVLRAARPAWDRAPSPTQRHSHAAPFWVFSSQTQAPYHLGQVRTQPGVNLGAGWALVCNPDAGDFRMDSQDGQRERGWVAGYLV